MACSYNISTDIIPSQLSDPKFLFRYFYSHSQA